MVDFAIPNLKSNKNRRNLQDFKGIRMRCTCMFMLCIYPKLLKRLKPFLLYHLIFTLTQGNTVSFFKIGSVFFKKWAIKVR